MKKLFLLIVLLFTNTAVAETCVLIHDVAHDSDIFLNAAPILQSEGCEVVGIDLPGHGLNPDTRGKKFGLLNVRDYADHIAEVVNTISQSDTITIIAHGGGATSALVALNLGLISAPNKMLLLTPYPNREIAWAYADNGGAEVEFHQWIESSSQDFYYVNIPEDKFAYLFFGGLQQTIITQVNNREPYVALSQLFGMDFRRRPSLSRNLLSNLDATIVYYKKSYFFDSPTSPPLPEMASYLGANYVIVDQDDSYHDCLWLDSSNCLTALLEQ